MGQKLPETVHFERILHGSYRFERILHGSYRSPAVHGCESYPDSYSSGATPTPIPTVDFADPILNCTINLLYTNALLTHYQPTPYAYARCPHPLP